MKQSGVYAIVHTASGRRYVGSAANISARWSGHRGSLIRGIHKNVPLQEAWNTCGQHAFALEVLEVLDDLEQLHIREQFWIDHFRPEIFNLNSTTRAHWLGKKRGAPSEATRQRLSRTNRGKSNVALKGTKRTFSTEHRANIRAHMLGRKASPEARLKMSISARNRKRPFVLPNIDDPMEAFRIACGGQP